MSNDSNDLFDRINHFPLEASASRLAWPDDKRVPFGWQAAAVDCAGSGNIAYLQSSCPNGLDFETIAKAFLRITVAVDVREEKRIEVVLSEDKRLVGSFDIRYAYVLQMFEIPIEPGDVGEVMRQGVQLRMVEGELPLWFFTDLNSEGQGELLLPHLLVVTRTAAIGAEPREEMPQREQQFLSRLASVASIQPFGWMEGCVLDALADFHIACPDNALFFSAYQQRLALFIDDSGQLIYENPRSVPFDGAIYGIEGTLPFAPIARVWPEHPVLELALAFWLSKRRERDGLIADGGTITAEGAYTVAYPLAVLARQRKRSDLAELAAANLVHRTQALAYDQGLYWINRHGAEGERYFNWARAYAWYMLGIVRSVIELKEMDESVRPVATERLTQEFGRIAAIALSYQREDGLWTCFLHEADTGVDTSGSAGIAAAIALGAKHGLLPDEAGDKARQAYEALLPYLTSDGMLGGVAQSNRKGEALQRSGYRVISQMAMGLMGQLAAAIGRVAEGGRPDV